MAQRYFRLQELLAAQGLQYFLSRDVPLVMMMPDEQFLDKVANIEKRSLQSMCGTSMHVAQVGSLLAIIFMFLARKKLEYS